MADNFSPRKIWNDEDEDPTFLHGVFVGIVSLTTSNDAQAHSLCIHPSHPVHHPLYPYCYLYHLRPSIIINMYTSAILASALALSSQVLSLPLSYPNHEILAVTRDDPNTTPTSVPRTPTTTATVTPPSTNEQILIKEIMHYLPTVLHDLELLAQHPPPSTTVSTSSSTALFTCATSELAAADDSGSTSGASLWGTPPLRHLRDQLVVRFTARRAG
ncbi:hypothetical protein EIP91_004113 [Steccherinum ochraceum]|uniref:Uncharacterized protein n=1 Tax=Steccherinum ochraceum TaxID=92696 RepID=A0A4V2MW25_9APHY|nr:hypothetical protein EIP91_004113 [Steccherinum ochraceum]